jgi:hypothetical protein
MRNPNSGTDQFNLRNRRKKPQQRFNQTIFGRRQKDTQGPKNQTTQFDTFKSFQQNFCDNFN